MSTIIIIVIAIIIISTVIGTRNNFETLRRSIKTEGANIGIYIEKRSDCLNDAMNIAKIGHKNEIEGIAHLTQNDQLNQLAFLAQKYPDLKGTAEYGEIIRQAMVLDGDIAASRIILNGNIDAYNAAISSFPGLIIAKICGYKEEKLVDEENIAQNVKLKKKDVDFSQFS